MFRAITNGLRGLLLKRRGSISELPEATSTRKGSINQVQPQPVQSNVQASMPTNTSSSSLSNNKFRRNSTANNMARLSISGNSSASQFSESINIKLLKPDNPVTVRIWASKTGDGQETYGINAILKGGNIGHATLETNNIYASIWPNSPVSVFGLKQSINSAYQDSVDDDIRLENDAKPDYVFVFYSLDTKAIETMFQKIKTAQEPWTLFGNAVADKGHSCSSLTLLLLEQGGLNNIIHAAIRGVVSPTSNFVVSPNNLVNQLSLAQRLESSKFPEILDFKQEGSQPKLQKRESLILTVISEKISVMDAQENRANRDDESIQLKGSKS